MHISVERQWSLADTHRHVSVRPPWTEKLAPAHLLLFIMRSSGDLLHVLDDEIRIQYQYMAQSPRSSRTSLASHD